MLLAVDIGNSNIKFGVFDGANLLSKFSIATDRDATTEKIKAAIEDRLGHKFSNAIVCCVVPDVEPALTDFLQTHLNIKPIFVRNNFDFGLTVNYEPIDALGTDRLVNAFATAEKYGAPCIVCSFGTATTIDVVDKDRILLGGMIAPGMKTMASALHLGTAKLPEVEIQTPESLLGNTTAASIQSGIVNGHAAMVDGLIGKIKRKFDDDAKVIATGGWAAMIEKETNQIDIVDESLTLDGLRRVHERSYSSPTATNIKA